MKKHISIIIFVLSIILVLPLLLKTIFNYEMPNRIAFLRITVDSWSTIRVIGGIVISYVVYTNITDYKENKRKQSEIS